MRLGTLPDATKINTIHSYRRTGGRHPHKGSREDKVCLLQRETGDDEESLPVAGMDRLSIQRELWYRGSSDSGSVKGSITGGNRAEGASKSEQHVADILLEHFPH